MFKHKFLEFPELIESRNDQGRIYITPDQIAYQSVTTILGEHLPKGGLDEWIKRVGEQEAERMKNSAAFRGSKIHKIAEDYLLNKHDFKKGHMPDAIAMFNYIKPYLDDNIKNIYGIECPLYSRRLKTAGRSDLLCTWGKDLAIVDFKNSRRQKKEEYILSYFMQTTCYGLMVEELFEVCPTKIVLIITCAEDNPQIIVKDLVDYREQTEKFYIEHGKEILISNL